MVEVLKLCARQARERGERHDLRALKLTLAALVLTRLGAPTASTSSSSSGRQVVVSALGRHHSVSPARTTLLACSWPLPSHALTQLLCAPVERHSNASAQGSQS